MTERVRPGRYTEWARAAGIPVLVVVSVLVVFAPAYRSGFLEFDDASNLTSNQGFRGLDAERVGWMFTTSWMGPYQPLAWLSYGVDYTLFGLDEAPERAATGFHATSVALHALTALALYLFALRLFARALPTASSGWLRLAAGTAALLFAVHPLRVESVVWLSERRDVLSGLFFVLACLVYLVWAPDGERADAHAHAKYRPARWVGAAATTALALGLFLWLVDRSDAGSLALRPPGAAGLVALAAALLVATQLSATAVRYAPATRPLALHATVLLTLLALLSKGLAVVLPAGLLVLDVWPLRRTRCVYASEHGEGTARAAPRASVLSALPHLVLEKLPLWLLSLVFSLLAVWGQAAQHHALRSLADHGLLERTTQAAYGLAYYPFRTLLPVALAPMYELPERISLLEPRFALAFAGVACVSGVALLLVRRWPAVLAAWVTFALFVSPVLGFFQAGPQLVADRYSYLACLPLALLGGGALLCVGRAGFRARAAALATAIAIVLLLGTATYRYASVWRDSETLWSYAHALRPGSPVATLNLANARARASDGSDDPAEQRRLLDEAIGLMEQGLTVTHGGPGESRFLVNLAAVHVRLARVEPSRRREHLLEAERLSSRGVRLAEQRGSLIPAYRLRHAVDLIHVERLEEAEIELERFVALEPASFDGRFYLGSVQRRLARTGPERERAIEQLAAAVRLDPASERAWLELARAFAAAGNGPAAERAYERLLMLRPEHAEARLELDALAR